MAGRVAMGGEVDSTFPVPSGMRVVILERDAETRVQLQRAIDQIPCFVLVGLAESWAECLALVEEYVPEVVMARAGLVPEEKQVEVCDLSFPLMIRLEAGPVPGAKGDDFRVLSDGLDQKVLHEMLLRLSSEVYKRKAEELSSLLNRYLAGACVEQVYVSKLRVDDGQRTVEVTTEDLIAIAASGNYVRIHTPRGAYQIRETMTGIGAKLDPICFARVHRCYIVNLAHVCELSPREDVPPSLLLSNGMVVPVGPNYRADIAKALTTKLGLTA